MWNCARSATGTPSQTAAMAFSSPGAPSTMRNSGRRRSALDHRSSSTVRQASVLAPPRRLHREQHFLAVGPHADNDKQRDRGRFAVEPHPYHGAVENEPHDWLFGQRTGVPGIPVGLHLAPHPAHRVLAHRPAKQRRERPADPTCVGAGEVGRGNQGVGDQCAALIGAQRRTAPLRSRAVRPFKPGARRRDLDPAKGSGQRPRPPAVAVADSGRSARCRRDGLWQPAVAPAQQRGVGGSRPRSWPR